ncbi:serine/threonine protein kinase [Rothia sp. P13129]|uniref:serine/threonine protein kinase n=1 Tax=Rothia sp. P13129 TaxID=3402664 RepID=UPI003ABF83A6
MSHSHSSHPIAINTVLGERYRVTAAIAQTEHGDAVLEGKDQVLNRRVSIVVASPAHNDRLIANARLVATTSRSPIQVLDLGNSEGRTYLVTSYSRPEALLENLLADSSAVAASSETQEALGQEIFGDEVTTGKTPYAEASKPAPEDTSISATRAVDDQETLAPDTVEESSYEEEYDEYDYPDEPEFDDEDDQRSGGVWIVAIAAIILLVLGVAIVFSSINGMVSKKSENENVTAVSASATATPSQKKSSEPSETPSPSVSHVPPKITNVTRLVPSSPDFMADQDATLPQMLDGNPASTWISYGFATPNFGGATDSFALAFQLQERTVVSELTIEQINGSGGAFTVYTNNTPSLDGATEVGSGSFNAPKVNVKLDQKKQGEGIQYVLVKFTEAPLLGQPIAGYNYGVRIAEVTAR